jgi:hypothetical protein
MIPPDHLHRFEEALRANQPGQALYDLAISLRDGGTSQLDLYDLFSHFFVLLQDTSPDDEATHTAITDVMDEIWFPRRLYPTGLSNEKVDDHRRKTSSHD